jgi:hypothetical protein
MTDDRRSRRIDQFERALIRDALDDVERGLARDDPAFVRSFRHRCRMETAAVVAVLLLLASGIVLLAVGLTTPSWPAWIAGELAFLAAFAVPALRERTLRRSQSASA